MINQNYVLDMVPGGMPVRVPVSQYDDASRDIVFSLIHSGVAFPVPAGADVTCDGTKPDKKAVMVPCAFDGSEVTVTVTEQMAAVAGESPFQITIRSGGAVIGSANFILAVEKGPISDDSIISDSDMSAIAKHANDAIRSAQEAAQSASDAAAAKNDVLSLIEGASDDVNTAISNANEAKTALETTITNAGTANTTLNASISDAGTTKSGLDSANATAADLIETLQNTHGGYYTPTVDEGGNISWSKNYDVMPDLPSTNIKGPKGDKGDTGTTFTPSVSADGVISWTNDGGKANPDSVNIKGPKGDKGETGRGLQILGYYATVSALQSAVPSPTDGDAYGIGTAAPYDIYIYDSDNGWVNNGQLQGAKGDPGTIFTPSVSEDGVLSWTNDGGLENPAPVDIMGSRATTTSVSLPASGWSGNTQTVSDANLLTGLYAYVVTPAPGSHNEYASCMIRAADITTAGQITFTAEETPANDLTVSILRIEVE